MSFVQIIDNELKLRGITAKKMLLDLGYSDSLISQWKKGKKPSIDKIENIAMYLEVSTDYLLGLTKVRTVSKYTDDKLAFFIYDIINHSEDFRDNMIRLNGTETVEGLNSVINLIHLDLWDIYNALTVKPENDDVPNTSRKPRLPLY